MASLLNWFKKQAEGVVAQVNPWDNGATYNNVVNRPQAPTPVQRPQPNFVNQAIGGFNRVANNGINLVQRNLIEPIQEINTLSDISSRLTPEQRAGLAQSDQGRKLLRDIDTIKVAKNNALLAAALPGPTALAAVEAQNPEHYLVKAQNAVAKQIAEPSNQTFMGGRLRNASNLLAFGAKINPGAIAQNYLDGGQTYKRIDEGTRNIKEAIAPEAGKANSLSPTRVEDYNDIQKLSRTAGSIQGQIAEQALLMKGASWTGKTAGSLAGGAFKAPLAAKIATNTATGAGAGATFGGLSSAMQGQSVADTLKSAGGWGLAGGISGGVLPLIPNAGKIPFVKALPRAFAGSGLGALTAPLTGFEPWQGALFGLMGGGTKPYTKQDISKIKGNVVKDLKSKPGGYVTLPGVAGKDGVGKSFLDKSGKSIIEVSDKGARIKIDPKALPGGKLRPGENLTTVGGVLKHDKLYRHYPEIKNNELNIRIGKGLSGGQTTTTNGITTHSVLAPNRVEAKKTLMHELQHYIQDKEKLSAGGSPGSLVGNRGKTQKAGLSGYYKLGGESQSRNVANRIDMGSAERIKTPFNKTLDVPLKNQILVRESTNARSIPLPREVSGTPFRGKPGNSLAAVNKYYESTRAKSYENLVNNNAPKYKIKVEGMEKTGGVWQGSVEPSYKATVRGNRVSTKAYAAEIGEKYNQDGMIVFSKGRGKDAKYEFKTDNPQALVNQLKKHGIDGATASKGKVEIIDFGGELRDNINKLSKDSGVKYNKVVGFADYLDKGDYKNVVREHTRNISSIKSPGQGAQGTVQQFNPEAIRASQGPANPKLQAELRAIQQQQRAGAELLPSPQKAGYRQPDARVVQGSQQFQAEHGLSPVRHEPKKPLDESLSRRIADAYDKLKPDNSRDPKVHRAYTALQKDVEKQWEYATKKLGVKFEPWNKAGQPYKDSAEMASDIAKGHLYFFKGGEPHPFLGKVSPKTGHSYNEMFRAIHDYYGHGSGSTFSASGEERAWFAHSQMFSKEAQKALTTETRGQNSWVNFGKQNYDAHGKPLNIPPAQRPFAKQKVDLLPDEFSDYSQYNIPAPKGYKVTKEGYLQNTKTGAIAKTDRQIEAIQAGKPTMTNKDLMAFDKPKPSVSPAKQAVKDGLTEEQYVKGQVKTTNGIKYIDPKKYSDFDGFIRDMEKLNKADTQKFFIGDKPPVGSGGKISPIDQVKMAQKLWGDRPRISQKEMSISDIKLVERPLAQKPSAGRNIDSKIEVYFQDGKHNLIDGRHRLDQAIANGQRTIKADVSGESQLSQLRTEYQAAKALVTPTPEPELSIPIPKGKIVSPEGKLVETTGVKKVGDKYEVISGDYYRKQGYKVEQTGLDKGVKDYGKDVIAKKGNETLVIQAKVRGKEKVLQDRPVQYHSEVVAQYQQAHPGEKVRGVITLSSKADKNTIFDAQNHNLEIRFIDRSGKEFAKPIIPFAKQQILSKPELTTKDQTRMLNAIPVSRRPEFLTDIKNPKSQLYQAMATRTRDKWFGVAEDHFKAKYGDETYQLTSLKGMAYKLATAQNETAVSKIVNEANKANASIGGRNTLFEQLATKIQKNPDFATKIVTEKSQYKMRKLLDPGHNIYSPVEAGTKERGFITTVKESPMTSPGVAKNVDSKYTKLNNQQTLDEASKAVGADQKGNILDMKKFNKEVEVARFSNDVGTMTQAKSVKLVSILQSKSRDQEAVDIVEKMAERGTKTGQASQILAAYDALTPEGILTFAQRGITKAKQQDPQKYANLRISTEQSKMLKKMAFDLRGLQGDEKIVAQKEMLDEIGRLVPTPMISKAVTLWKGGLLTGFKGAVSGNAVGNTSNAVIKKLSDVPAVAFDAALSKVSGFRSKSLTLKGIASGGVDGTKMGYRAMKLGTGAEELTTKLDYKKVYFSKSFLGRSAQAYTDTVFGFYSAADKPFKMSAMRNSLYDLAITEAKNKGLRGAERAKFVNYTIKNPPDEMLTRATNEALDAVFQDKNAIGMALSGLKKGLGKKGPVGDAIGNIIAPFTGVPSSVAFKAYKYSPAAPAVEVYKAIRSASRGTYTQAGQRDLAEAMGKGLTGTGVVVLGAKLYNDGILTLGSPSDAREKALWKLEGKQPWSIKVFGEWRSLNYTGPVLTLLGAGGTFAQQIKSGKDPVASTVGTIGGVIKSVLESSPLKGVQSALDVVSYPDRYAERYVEQLSGSTIPTISADIANATDPYKREIMSAGESVMSRIPGLRQKLNPQLTPFGEPTTNPQFGAGAIVDPFRSSPAKSDPLTSELRSLYDNDKSTATIPSEISKSFYGNDKEPLTEKQIYEITAKIQPEIKSAWEKIIASPGYQNLTPEQKKKALDQVAQDIRGARKFETGVQGGFLNEKDARKSLERGERRVLRGASTDYLGKVQTASGSEDVDPKTAYEDALSRYNDMKKAGEISGIEDIRQRKQIATLHTKSNYKKDVVDLYSLSKNDILDYVESVQDGQDLLNNVIALDAELGGSKFHDKYGNVRSGRAGSGGGRGRKGSGSFVTTGFKTASASKIRTPKGISVRKPSYKGRAKRLAVSKLPKLSSRSLA